MTRRMIDVTHDGLPATLPTIKALPQSSVVALYDTGSPDIAATPADIAQIPHTLHTVFIDQGFTGSPNFNATVRDCENGAWTLAHAVNKTGWHVPRPTLYLGFPDSAAGAAAAGWKGDVWLVAPSAVAPVTAPTVPAGLNVVAVQWKFTSSHDESVIFDRSWPMADPPAQTFPFNQTNWRWCHKCQGLFYGPGTAKSHCPAGGQHDGTQSGNYEITDTAKH